MSKSIQELQREFEKILEENSSLKSLRSKLKKKVDVAKITISETDEIEKKWSADLTEYVHLVNVQMRSFEEKNSGAKKLFTDYNFYRFGAILGVDLSPYLSEQGRKSRLLIKGDFFGYVGFDNMKMYSTIDFADCNFRRGVSFKGCEFNNGVTFTNCAFYKLSASFVEIKIRNQLHIETCQFHEPPNFDFDISTIQLLKNIAFRNVEFKNFSAHFAERLFALMSHNFSLMGKENISRIAKACELEARRVKVKKWSEDWLILNAYKFINGYGMNPLQPLVLLAFGWLFFYTLLIVSYLWCSDLIYLVPVSNGLHGWREDLLNPVARSIVYSGEILLGPVKLFSSSGLIASNVCLKLFSILLTMLSTVLWFMLLIGIRKHLKIEKPE